MNAKEQVKILTELEEAEMMSVEEFVDKVKSAYMKQFPKGWIKGGWARSSMGGHGNITFYFGITPPANWANKISDNDASYHLLMIHDVNDKEQFTQPKNTIELLRGGNVHIAPAPDSYYAFDNVKVGWRKKTGSPEQLVKHLDSYFKKLKKIAVDNKDKIKDGIGV